MPKSSRTTIQCPNCGQPVNAVVEMIIDAGQDPQAKMRLLSGRTNTTNCPNCGAPLTVASPLIYHDADKELLIEFVPMEMAMPQQQQERVLGDLSRELMNEIPPEGRKGYLFNPRKALTMQGLVDQVLQADGVTPEMMEEQRQRVELIETLIRANSLEELITLIQQNNDAIDAQFFQTMTMMAQRLAAEGRTDVAERIVQTQGVIIENSTFGQEVVAQSQRQEQLIEAVSADIEALGEEADLSEFMDVVAGYAGDDQKLQAFVGLMRPVMDNTFFQELTARISQAPADERATLEDLRDKLLQYVAVVDQQAQAAVQGAVSLLQAALSSPDPEQLLRENAPMMDDTFMAVLSANIQEAEKRGDINASGRLKQLYGLVVSILQENMQPELRFINEALTAPSEEDARSIIAEQADEFGEEILQVMDAVREVLQARGDAAMLQRLDFLRSETARVLN